MPSPCVIVIASQGAVLTSMVEKCNGCPDSVFDMHFASCVVQLDGDFAISSSSACQRTASHRNNYIAARSHFRLRRVCIIPDARIAVLVFRSENTQNVQHTHLTRDVEADRSIIGQ